MTSISTLDEAERMVRSLWLFTACHKYNLEPSLVQYIYRISYKIAKRQTPEFGPVIFENFRHQLGELSDLSKVFRKADIPQFQQAIKGFDKPDSCEVISMCR
jgi:hypothetical protein